jgi:hypothetical protein
MLLPLGLVVALAACGGRDADEAGAPRDGAAGQQATTPPAGGPASPTFAEEHANYRLTMPAVRRWYEAQANIYRAIGENPDLADEVETFNEARSFAEMEAHFNGIPAFRAAVTRAGLEMRDYVAILVTLFHARSVDTVIQGGGDRAQTIANREVNPANLELVEQNRAELDRLERQLEEMAESMQ